MNKFVTDRTPGPASTEHRLVPIEIFLAHPAQTRQHWKRHRLPLATSFSNTHKERSIAGRPAETQASLRLDHPPNQPILTCACYQQSGCVRLNASFSLSIRQRSGHRRNVHPTALFRHRHVHQEASWGLYRLCWSCGSHRPVSRTCLPFRA